ncbi:MAG TPA: hypothetical protein VNE62_01635 [Actinomycetota bacterium]|nr:hypothetical protein [Actinomycetota bacterium]
MTRSRPTLLLRARCVLTTALLLAGSTFLPAVPASAQEGTADLELLKTCRNQNTDTSASDQQPLIVSPGDRIQCAITVANHGPAEATEIVATDDVPAELRIVSVGGPFHTMDCTVHPTSPELRCSKDSLAENFAANAIYHLVVTDRAAPGSTFSNFAEAQAAQPDPDPTNNSDSVSFATLACTLDARGARSGRSIRGTSGADVICGSHYGDSINGLGGNDLVYGLGGNDAINGAGGNDNLVGGSGNDAIRGGTGNDRLSGGSGNDSLSGDSGSDSADGGLGRDACRAESLTAC